MYFIEVLHIFRGTRRSTCLRFDRIRNQCEDQI